MSEKNNFRFFIPIDSITKSKDATGKIVMKMAGYASTKRRDTDGEILHPNGFDISYLKDKGIVNWNHERSPEAIIGEPAVAEIRKQGLFIESLLYSESKKAKQVYNLAQTLKKSNAKRKLGYSVEGKALERDPADPSQVTKAMITNVAITISPKNPDSSIDIIKGSYQEWSDSEKPPVVEDVDFDDIEKSIDSDILNLVRPDGIKVSVDSKYNIRIEKGESKSDSEEDDEEEKALTTANGAAVIPEHVDGETKDMLNGAPQKTKVKKGEDDDAEDTNFLTEDEVLLRIMKSNSVINFSQANEILKTLNTLTMQKNGKTTEISEDLLEKSLAKLGFSKTKNIVKGEKKEAGEEEEDDDEKEEDEQEEGKTPGKNKKGIKKSTTISKKYKHEDEDDDEEDREEEDRDEEDNEDEKPDGSAKTKKKAVKKSNPGTMRKSIEVGDDLREEMFEGMAEVRDMVKSVGVIAKGCYDIMKSQQEEIAELRQTVEEFGSAPANGGRKSVTVKKSVERNFEKGMGGDDTIEKSENGFVKVDINKARHAVLNMFDVMAFQKGAPNAEMMQAMKLFEASSTIRPHIQKALENEFKVSLYKNL